MFMIRLFMLLPILMGLAVMPAPTQSAEPAPIAASKLSEDIQAVTGAILLRLMGDHKTQPVVFADKPAAALDRSSVVFPGFDLYGMSVSDYRALPPAGEQIGLTAVLHMQDLIERRTLIAISARYRPSEKGIFVEQAAAVPFYPAVPQVKLFFVPASADPKATRIHAFSHAELFAFVLKHAVKTPPGRKDYYVFAFFLDRLADDAAVQLRVSEREGGMEGRTDGAYVLHFAGWPVVVMRGVFDLAAPQPLYFKALYKPGSHVPQQMRKVVLAGTFSTLRPAISPATSTTDSR
jgi:hypothetical protein